MEVKITTPRSESLDALRPFLHEKNRPTRQISIQSNKLSSCKRIKTDQYF